MPTPAPQDCAWSTGANLLAHEVPPLDLSSTGPDTGSFFAVFTDFRILSPVPVTFGLGMSPPSFRDSGSFQVTAVPEPSTDALPIAGLALVWVSTPRLTRSVMGSRGGS